MNEYQEMWNSLREYLEENSSQEINVSRIAMVMNLMEKARTGK